MNTFETFEVTAAEFANAHVDSWQCERVLDHIDYRSGEGILVANMMALVNPSDCKALAGYYYWFCQPGCLPDGDAHGPFDNHHDACAAAHSEFRGGDPDRYSVIVGNIGEVETTNDRREASRVYNEYVRQSKLQTGRASGEDVTIMDDGEPIRQYDGKG